MNLKSIRIAVLPGDGIGADVTHAAAPVFSELGLPIQLQFGDIGWEFWQKEGNPIPDRTWSLINSCDVTLLGAITSKPEREAIQSLPASMRSNPPEYISPIIQLRQHLNLYANVRPCFSLEEDKKPFNLCVIRENTEGLYSGLDFAPLPPSFEQILRASPRWKDKPLDELAGSIRLQSKKGLIQIFKYAFQYASQHHLSRVTFADKPNVTRKSSAFARALFEQVAAEYPSIQADILNVDAVALWMVRKPESFGVIVAENLFGDILSDVGAAVMGGLGFAPSANIGANGCYFEPVHGSGPAIKPGSANPCAMFLTISLLLKHFGFNDQAVRIRQAVYHVINQKKCLTYDLGGQASTIEMAEAVIHAYQRLI